MPDWSVQEEEGPWLVELDGRDDRFASLRLIFDRRAGAVVTRGVADRLAADRHALEHVIARSDHASQILFLVIDAPDAAVGRDEPRSSVVDS